MKKILVDFNEQKYIIFLTDHKNRITHLIDAIKKKKGLSFLNLNDYDFLIFDKDFETYVLLDDEIEIENLSKVTVHEKKILNNNHLSNFLNLNYKLSNNTTNSTKINLNNNKNDDDSQTNESIVISINPNDLNNQSTSTNNLIKNSDFNQNSTINDQLIDQQQQMTPQNLFNNESNNNNNNNFLNDESNQFSELSNEDSIDWTDDEIFYLMEFCKGYIQEFTYYNIDVDLANLDLNDNELWEQISLKLKQLLNKPIFTRQQCKSRFIKLRTTYINICAYSEPEDTYFGQLKYFQNLKLLIDGQKPTDDKLKLKSQNKEKPKDRNCKDRLATPSYVALIQQVKNHSKQFAGEIAKTKIWDNIAENLNAQGYTFTGKSCQGTFHRLRYQFLHLIKTITSEQEGINKWPYFLDFQSIDLTPFTSRRQEVKRKPRKSTNTTDDTKNGEEEDNDLVDEEFEVEDNDFENFDNFDNFNDNDQLSLEFPSSRRISKRIRTS